MFIVQNVIVQIYAITREKASKHKTSVLEKVFLNINENIFALPLYKWLNSYVWELIQSRKTFQ